MSGSITTAVDDAAALPGGTPRVKCLLVDDREEGLRVLGAVLRRDDVEVLKARSGPAALELLLVHDVALAIIDVRMPDMDGFELAELMRGSERTRHVPIIFVTAAARDQARTFQGYGSGAVDFLHKPLEPQVLAGKADVFFRLHRQQHQLAAQLAERTEALRLNELFTAALGHDLRSPLSAIVTGADLLRNVSTQPEVVDVAGRMLSCSRRMARMIDDMADLARARLAGGIPVNRETTDLAQTVERVLTEHADDAAIEVSRRGSTVGYWDGGRLARLVSNLVRNAVEHGARGTVHLDIDGDAPGMVALEVRNRGTIAPDLLPHVFEPFRGRANAREGLGLGLYIVRQIAEAHDGRVTVRSDETHTSFRVELPRRPV